MGVWEIQENPLVPIFTLKYISINGPLQKENSIDPFVIFGYGKVGQHVFAGNKKIEHAIEVTKDVSHKSILYTVKDGDTLWDIAEKFNTKISVIIKSNNLSDEKIIPGQKLIISNRSS